MLTAYSLNENRKVWAPEITPGKMGYLCTCPKCRRPVTYRKNGHIISFGHDSGNEQACGLEDELRLTNSFSPWHIQLQEKFPVDEREVWLETETELLRPDILIDGQKIIIEFVTDLIPAKDFFKRNKLYTENGYKVIWLYDLEQSKGQFTVHQKKDLRYSIDAAESETWNRCFKNYMPHYESNKNIYLCFTWQYNDETVIFLCDYISKDKTMTATKIYTGRNAGLTRSFWLKGLEAWEQKRNEYRKPVKEQPEETTDKKIYTETKKNKQKAVSLLFEDICEYKSKDGTISHYIRFAPSYYSKDGKYNNSFFATEDDYKKAVRMIENGGVPLLKMDKYGKLHIDE